MANNAWIIPICSEEEIEQATNLVKSLLKTSTTGKIVGLVCESLSPGLRRR
jgi:hypothetical protein